MADNETPEMDEYEIDVHGITHTVQLDADTAEQIGARKTRAPRNKARDVEDK